MKEIVAEESSGEIIVSCANSPKMNHFKAIADELQKQQELQSQANHYASKREKTKTRNNNGNYDDYKEQKFFQKKGNM